MVYTVDSVGYFQPLGAKVLQDNRFEIIPKLRRYTEKIPGRDGAFDFGQDLEPRIIQITVGKAVSMEPTAPDFLYTFLRQVGALMNPHLGTQDLTFADDPGKVYKVKLIDAVDIPRSRTYVECTLTFEMASVYILSDTQRTLTGSGTAVNGGTVATPFTLTIHGPVTDPTVTVAGYEMVYTGTVEAGKVLLIDTEKLTAIYDNQNALPNYNRVFPKLQPGNNTVLAAEGGTTNIQWYDRWL